MKTVSRLWRSGGMVLLLAGGVCRLSADGGAPVLLDADWAADDARAAVLILSDPQWEVAAVVATDGASPPGAGATNASRILRAFGEESVPVGQGRSRVQPAPPFRANALALAWENVGPPRVPQGGFPAAVDVVARVLRESERRVLYVCLGPLTTLAEVLQSAPDVKSRIEAVLWFGSPPGAGEADWNARFDPEAVQQVAQAGLRVEAVGYPAGRAAPPVERGWVEKVQTAGGVAARIVGALHGTGRGSELVGQGHLRFWDDLVALRVVEPSGFRAEPVLDQPNWWRVEPEATLSVAEVVRGLITEAPLRQTVVLSRFPADPAWLREDVRMRAGAMMDRHGLEEWRAVVLTSELHRHLGTYSIVGAKMGLRARELLRAGLDEVRVESRAGSRPPLSCVNDGLQVATGASLGRGTIVVVDGPKPACEAVFEAGDRRLRLRLRREWADRIAHELAALVARHGGLSPSYFAAVREAALNHWLEMDRRSAFEEVWETRPSSAVEAPGS